jgi:hypothetical protein
MWILSGLGKCRPMTIYLNHHCNQGCRWKCMDGFYLFHLLSIMVIYIKGIQMTFGFKCSSSLR